jgi:dihydrofolate reductase
MRSVTYSMNVSLDGYIVGPDGGFDWPGFDEEVFRFWIDEIREVGVHLLGRRLYETMLYWETADQDPSLGVSELEWAALWKPLPKVVFSTTLSAVQGNARLASGGLAEEIERLRAEPEEGDIAIGGATLAAEAAALGLIDEYRTMVYPVLVGGGIPFFPQQERRVDLELVETRTFTDNACPRRCGVATAPARARARPARDRARGPAAGLRSAARRARRTKPPRRRRRRPDARQSR